jgi:hypothetical protein
MEAKGFSIFYPESHVAVPSFLFTVGIITGVTVTLLMLLRLTSFLIGLYIGLKHDLHKGHALITPKHHVGPLGLNGLTYCCREGLAFAVLATAVQGVVGLVGTAAGFTTLTKLLTATLLRDSTSRAPRCLSLGIALGFRLGCSSLTLCLELLLLLFNHDSLDSL